GRPPRGFVSDTATTTGTSRVSLRPSGNFPAFLYPASRSPGEAVRLGSSQTGMFDRVIISSSTLLPGGASLTPSTFRASYIGRMNREGPAKARATGFSLSELGTAG